MKEDVIAGLNHFRIFPMELGEFACIVPGPFPTLPVFLGSPLQKISSIIFEVKASFVLGWWQRGGDGSGWFG